MLLMVLMNDYNCLGIGLESVKTLLYVGCKVISGGRYVDAAKKSFKEADIDGHKNLIVYELDLENLSSIKSFADKCLYESRIDFLILNAGIMALPKLEYCTWL
jgi:NADP-dependent 3-hydroxy acid dehydrogenase YdfG